MISTRDTLSALGSALLAMPELPSIVAWPNTNPSSNPDADDTWLAVFMLDTNGESPTLSGAGHEIEEGIYQININTPKTKGAFAAADLCDAINAAFPRSVPLIKNDTKVIIQRVVKSAAGYETGLWYVKPVSVYWKVVG